MAIIKYSLDNGRIPSYITDGGNLLATDCTMIGIGRCMNRSLKSII